MAFLSGKWSPVAHAVSVTYWCKSQNWNYVESCRNGAWSASMRRRTLIFGEGDVHHCEWGADDVDSVDGAFRAVVEVPAEDCQGAFLLAAVVGEDRVVCGGE